MDTDWNLVGMLSPAGAVAGRRSPGHRPGLRHRRPAFGDLAQHDAAARTPGLDLVSGPRGPGQHDRYRLASSCTGGWFGACGAVRRSQARGSPTAALGWGLRTGLPAAAILMALTPLWGVSWFFNTETWVTGAWEVWAEQRTDTWRVDMVAAVKKEYGAAADDPDFFRVCPGRRGGGRGLQLRRDRRHRRRRRLAAHPARPAPARSARSRRSSSSSCRRT